MPKKPRSTKHNPSGPLGHKDMLGVTCFPGDIVAFSQYNILYIGKIVKNTPKLVHCSAIKQDGLRGWTSQQLPGTFIKLKDPNVMTWILRGARTKADIMYG